MMLGLIYKEFALGKRGLLFGAGMHLLIFITMFLMMMFAQSYRENISADFFSVVMAFSIFMCVNMMNGELFTKDERRIWANYAVSLPTSVKGQVKAKYYFVFIVNIIAFFLCTVTEWVIQTAFGATDGMGMMTGFIMLMVCLLMNAVEIPFSTRLGRKVGNYVMVIVFLLFFFIVAVYGLFGDISMFLGEEEIEDLIIKVMEFLMDSEVNAVIMGFEPWVILGLYFLSYKLSCRFYLKGVETYEQ